MRILAYLWFALTVIVIFHGVYRFSGFNDPVIMATVIPQVMTESVQLVAIALVYFLLWRIRANIAVLILGALHLALTFFALGATAYGNSIRDQIIINRAETEFATEMSIALGAGLILQILAYLFFIIALIIAIVTARRHRFDDTFG